MRKKNQKIKDYRKDSIDVDLKFSIRDTKNLAILATKKVGFFFGLVLINYAFISDYLLGFIYIHSLDHLELRLDHLLSATSII